MNFSDLSKDDKSLILRVLATPDGKKRLHVIAQSAMNALDPKQAKFERVRDLLRIISDELHEAEADDLYASKPLERLWSEITLYLETVYARGEA